MTSHLNEKGFGWSCSYYLVLYVLSIHILNTNTRSSHSHWKLVVEESSGRFAVVPTLSDGYLSQMDVSSFHQPPPATTASSSTKINLQKQVTSSSHLDKSRGFLFNNSLLNNDSSIKYSTKNDAAKSKSEDYFLSPEEQDELVLQILATTVFTSRGSWTKNGRELYCPGGCPTTASINDSGDGYLFDQNQQEILDCGRPANFTYYDQLIGVANRQNHPHIPEPEVAMIFKKKGSKKDTIDLNTLERKLRKAKKEKPSSVQLYNQIGNFWRIKGHTLRAIECFRRALSVAPNSAEVLHNLARLLLTQQYLDDALFLARRSLELQDRSKTIEVHFTLGEILKAYGNHQEALLHFKHTLELRPDHDGALEALRELENLLAGTGLHICTLLIIIFLVLGVLLVMLSSLENEENEIRQPPRHFNSAMRSLKLGRALKLRK